MKKAVNLPFERAAAAYVVSTVIHKTHRHTAELFADIL